MEVLVTADHCSHSIQAFSVFHVVPPVSRLVCRRGWEGTYLGQLTPPN